MFFELVVHHFSLFVHLDHARPTLLLHTTKSASCVQVQSVGQKLISNVLPPLSHHACWQLEVWRYTRKILKVFPFGTMYHFGTILKFNADNNTDTDIKNDF